jgi:hypothetical protein
VDRRGSSAVQPVQRLQTISGPVAVDDDLLPLLRVSGVPSVPLGRAIKL